MPLLLLSGILLPMALAPDWLQTLSTLNPLTHAVDAARALFNGQWGDPEIPIGGRRSSAVIAVWLVARTFSRAFARAHASTRPDTAAGVGPTARSSCPDPGDGRRRRGMTGPAGDLQSGA